MNILYPETISAQLTAITDEIRELLHGECPKYDEIIETIYIATYEQIKEQKSIGQRLWLMHLPLQVMISITMNL